eukprot:1208386-Pleurochrysis_carterae.AAC.1
MDMDAVPQAFDMVSFAPLCLPSEMNVSFFSIHPGVNAAPVMGSISITQGVSRSSGLILAVAPNGRMSLLEAFCNIFMAAQKGESDSLALFPGVFGMACLGDR